jgi:hypothetical protein
LFGIFFIEIHLVFGARNLVLIQHPASSPETPFDRQDRLKTRGWIEIVPLFQIEIRFSTLSLRKRESERGILSAANPNLVSVSQTFPLIHGALGNEDP